jgi:uncharacterized protein DUF3592
MRILEQRPGFLVCHQSPSFARGFGLLFAGLGAGALVLVTNVHQNVHGSPWVAYVVGGVFVIVGLYLFGIAEDDRIVLDGKAHVARIIRKGLWRQSTTEVPFASITDVALEVSAPMHDTTTTINQQFTWRPVFVCENGRIPWTPISTSDRTSQALAVAAARAVGGWNALPIDGSPGLGRAVGVVRSLGCLYAFAALFLGFLLFLVGIQVKPMLTWKPTPATVVSSAVGYVKSGNGMSWKPVIQYTYSVSGADYSSYRVAPLEQSASKNWALSISRRFPPGAAIIAWYDPRHPSDAIIDRRFATIPFIMMGIMVAVLLLFVTVAKRAQAASAAALAGGDVPVVSAR